MKIRIEVCTSVVAALLILTTLALSPESSSSEVYDLDPRIGKLDSGSGCCTATIVGRPDRVVSAGHCVDYVGQSAVFYAGFAGGRATAQSTATVIAMGRSRNGDAQNDWAVLELGTPLGESLGYFRYSTSAAWNEYQFLIAGWPHCEYPKVYEGIRVTLDRSKDDKFEVFGIRSKDGMSGGPVFHRSGDRLYFVGNYAQDKSRKPGRNPHFGAWVGKYSAHLQGSIHAAPEGPGTLEGRGVLICVNDGWSNCLLIDHDCPDLKRHLGHDFGDKISSLELRGVTGVRLYVDDSYRGSSMPFSHNCRDLKRHGNHNFGDKASSLRISW